MQAVAESLRAWIIRTGEIPAHCHALVPTVDELQYPSRQRQRDAMGNLPECEARGMHDHWCRSS